MPDPISLFLLAATLVAVLSWVLSAMGVGVEHPSTHEYIGVQNLLSAPNIQRMLTDAVKNFIDFPPLGLVLVTMIGISVAERGGFITALLRTTVHAVPHWLVTAAVVFAGVNSSIAADAGYVVLIPLGAVIFAAVNRHPLAGLSAAFAGVAGGFSANLSITSLDPLLSGLTQESAQLIIPSYSVSVAANWYFMIASTFLLTAVGTWVCERLVEPRLGPWVSTQGEHNTNMQKRLDAAERKAMVCATIVFFVGIGAVVAISAPQGSVMRDAQGSLAPLEHSIVIILMLLFLVSGLVYGVLVGVIKNDKDVATITADGMATMGGYIVLSFVMAQFIAYFKWSNLGVVTAVKGANFLQSLHFEGPLLICAFIVVASIINLLVASASAKWAIMAPVFVPMFMLMGISPETTQLAYRVGDSSTNMIAPLLSYIPLILYAMRRYMASSSLGTLMSLMIPYSLVTLIAWTLFVLLWLYLGIPIGPNTPVFMQQ